MKISLILLNLFSFKNHYLKYIYLKFCYKIVIIFVKNNNFLIKNRFCIK